MFDLEQFLVQGETIIKIVLSLLASIGIVIQVSPIKINPVSSLLNFLGKSLTKSLRTELDDISKRLSEVELTTKKAELDRYKWDIKRFAASCRRGDEHSKEEFEHVIKANTMYHTLLTEIGEENGVTDEDYKYILNIYHEVYRKNKFVP